MSLTEHQGDSARQRKELIRSEAKILMADQLWRLNNLYKVINKDSGKVTTFKLNWAQAQLYDELHFLNIILKARQLGFTTFIQLFMLDECLFNSNTRCAVIAHNLKDAQAIFDDKIKFPYDNLPEAIRAARPTIKDSASELKLSNNSAIRVGVSFRGGTLNYLHISELGKIAAKYPDKAREIRTGALNTIQAGQVCFIESTAEGEDGDFYQMCQTAQSKARMGSRLTALDFKFHFFPWHKAPEYRIDPEGVVIDAEAQRYFEKLALESNIIIPADKQAWWVKKLETQMEDMGREFPSTPEEAFAASVEGAFYGSQMAKAEAQGRIGEFKALAHLPVHTAWDIGVHDDTCIWFFQLLDGGRRVRLVGYYENNGEGMPFYAHICRELYRENRWLRNDDCTDWFPHDGRVKEWGSGKTRLEELIEAGFRPRIPKAMGLHDGINAVRATIPLCEYDAAGCAQGIKCLKNYKKTWDDDRSAWSKDPFHNWASHGADAKRTLAVALKQPGEQKPEPTEEDIARQAREERLRELAQQSEMRSGR
jgi:hypothetical protein